MKSPCFIFLLLSALFPYFAQADDIKIAVNVPSVPFIFQDENGRYIGFEAELIDEIAKLQNMSFQYIPATFPGIFKKLDNKEIDMIGNAYVSEQRRQKYHFTVPYYIDRLQFISLANTQMINPITNATRIAVLSDSPIEVEFEKIKQDFPKLERISSKTGFLAFKSLFLKKADAMTAPSSEVSYYTNNWQQYQYQRFELPADYQQEIVIAFLLPKENEHLLNLLNESIEKLKENGTYERLKSKYGL